MPTLLWNEGFESYTAGNDTITSPWSGASNTIISTAIKHSGAQSLGTGRGGNGGSTTRPLISLTTQVPIWTVDFWVYVPTGGDATDPPVTNGPGIRMADSVGGGNVAFLIGGAGTCIISVQFGATFHTFDLSLDTWHHIVWSVSQAASGGTSAVSVDGVAQTPFTGDTRNYGGTAYSDELTLTGQTIGPSPTAEVYFDDMNIYSGIPAANVNGPMIRMVG